MDNPIGQQISNHLELLGYEIKDESTTENKCKFTAKIVLKWLTTSGIVHLRDKCHENTSKLYLTKLSNSGKR